MSDCRIRKEKVERSKKKLGCTKYIKNGMCITTPNGLRNERTKVKEKKRKGQQGEGFE